MPQRRAAILVSLGALAAVLLLFARCSDPKGGRLVAAPETLKFGQVVVRDVVPMTLRLRNEGPRPVFVASVVSNCGCLRVPRVVDSLEPGEERGILLSLDTKRLSPMVLRGKKVEVFTNDPNAKHLVIPIEAEIIGTHDMSPLFVELGTLDETGRAREHRVALRPRPGVDLTVTGVSAEPSQLLNAEIRRLQGGTDVVVRVADGAPTGRGRVKGRLEIKVELKLPSGVQRERTEVVPMEGKWP